ncbi:unnamed protein product [Heligmosomoides polygyrus]|uniref:Uncharacterized protein n=1 Tax=Heligmosomoides polygyrus TaxID=6339 RepID=A0A183FV94_HELPZ|nr:unnamed protein product [Heligmosomoides polygyrus]
MSSFHLFLEAPLGRFPGASNSRANLMGSSEDVPIPPQALIPHLQLDRGCLRHCPNILVSFPDGSIHMPTSSSSSLQRAVAAPAPYPGPTFTAVEEGRPHNCSIELGFEHPGASTVAEDLCGHPPLEPGCVYPFPDRLVRTSSLGEVTSEVAEFFHLLDRFPLAV